ncbi:type II toxin-antitoxin system Phd/YefM family antitoxin [Rathayibacter sp. VKM Ac-2929]|uniref:type II toxin-antitoxin system Phd/YefM family antitoxin n=1 Tax=Rathayibacter sp. VKM Ac-2929 TaxID=2929480 RepID=UPI001FB48A6F|nr:type II toxin-antitoxin system Phd/YefM family antitoxin [Rathayibacter sp. VKM Ac-2929]MCJ1671778.1 type II toxin-antitoxin system Phd/YefM family antitoxin [Rathayibacter sp. VKM Ac-2929]
MPTISVTDACANFSELIIRSRTEAVIIVRQGRPEAVLISPEQHERMRDALEDAEEVKAFDAALAEDGDNIPWSEAKAELGRLRADERPQSGDAEAAP